MRIFHLYVKNWPMLLKFWCSYFCLFFINVKISEDFTKFSKKKIQKIWFCLRSIFSIFSIFFFYAKQLLFFKSTQSILKERSSLFLSCEALIPTFFSPDNWISKKKTWKGRRREREKNCLLNLFCMRYRWWGSRKGLTGVRFLYGDKGIRLEGLETSRVGFFGFGLTVFCNWGLGVLPPQKSRLASGLGLPFLYIGNTANLKSENSKSAFLEEGTPGYQKGRYMRTLIQPSIDHAGETTITARSPEIIPCAWFRKRSLIAGRRSFVYGVGYFRTSTLVKNARETQKQLNLSKKMQSCRKQIQ